MMNMTKSKGSKRCKYKQIELRGCDVRRVSEDTSVAMSGAEMEQLSPANSTPSYGGVAKKARKIKPKTYRSEMTCGATQDFWWRIKMAFSMAVGVMVAATPSLLLYAGIDMGPFTPPTWLDGYAPVITIFVCGYNMGETNEYNYQAIIGVIPAQLFCTAWVAVFGLDSDVATPEPQIVLVLDVATPEPQIVLVLLLLLLAPTHILHQFPC